MLFRSTACLSQEIPCHNAPHHPALCHRTNGKRRKRVLDEETTDRALTEKDLFQLIIKRLIIAKKVINKSIEEALCVTANKLYTSTQEENKKELFKDLGYGIE